MPDPRHRGEVVAASELLPARGLLNARVPRIRCQSCGVRLVSVPWAREGSGFTLLFEAMVMPMLHATPVADVARQVGEHDTRLWRGGRLFLDEGPGGGAPNAGPPAAPDEAPAAPGRHY